MKAQTSTLVVLAGSGLAIGGITQAFDAAGLDPNLRLVLGWSLLGAFGLYLIAWGLVKYMLADPPSNVRPIPSSSYSTAYGTPSSYSRAKRRDPSDR